MSQKVVQEVRRKIPFQLLLRKEDWLLEIWPET